MDVYSETTGQYHDPGDTPEPVQKPRNSPRRKCISKAIGLLRLAWGELPMEGTDEAAALIEQAVDDLQVQMEEINA